ncbi:MAG: DNA/RNA nuclease SfsA, partial [Dehalococcoidia bacterium]|nr:DNA/RNA nuclease SfsA [Dehalococcoidia bacterium]
MCIRDRYCLPRCKTGRTAYRLIGITQGAKSALIDTSLQMKAFEGAVVRGLVPWLKGAAIVRRNIRIGESLLDYLLARDGQDVYLEVKSAVFRSGDFAMYPDCPTARGRRHIRELADLARSGKKTVILFVAALPGVRAFRPNIRADEALYRGLLEARKLGVELRAMRMALDVAAKGVIIDGFDLPVAITLKESEK